jgi:hypothetical protein
MSEAGFTGAVKSTTRLEGSNQTLLDNIFVNFSIDLAKVLTTTIRDHLAPVITFKKKIKQDLAERNQGKLTLSSKVIQSLKLQAQNEDWGGVLNIN